MIGDDILLKEIISGLVANSIVFQHLLQGIEPIQYHWKPEPSKWCLLEVVCHLYDEEREDFKTRLKHILDGSSGSFPPINPTEWVTTRKYMEQKYQEKLTLFSDERNQSVMWLKSLTAPNWHTIYEHPKLRAMSARMVLCNWLAHDYLHIRQITRLKYEYLKNISGENLDYAGTW